MRILILLFKSLLAISLVFILFWITALGTLQTKSGQTWALSQAVGYLEKQTGTKIEAEKIEFIFPLGFRIYGILISQEQSPLVKVQQLDVSCAYGKLLEGRLICPFLYANGIEILKIPPHYLDRQNNSRPAEPLTWGKSLLPFYFKIENLLLQNIHLSPLVIEQLSLPPEWAKRALHSSLNLKGSLRNNPFKDSLSSQLLLKIIDIANQAPSLYLSVDLQDSQLALSLHYAQFPYPLTIRDHPFHLETSLAFFASAPLITWQNAAENRLSEEEQIEGQFKLTIKPSISHSDDLLVALVGEEATFKGKYAWRVQNILHLWDVQLASSSLALQGKALLAADGQIHQSYFEGEVRQIAHLSPWLSKSVEGQLSLKGNITDTLNQPTLTLQGTSDSLTIQNQILQNIQATINLSLRKHHSEGFLNLIFNYQQQPCRLATSFNITSDFVELSSIQINSLHSHLQGELSFSQLDRIWKGQLQAYSGSLKDFNPLISLPAVITGEVQLNAYFKPIWSNQTLKYHQGIDCDLAGHALQWENLQADHLKMSIHLDPLDENDQIFRAISHLKGQKIWWEDKYVDYLDLSTTYQVDFFHFNLTDLSAHLSSQGLKWNKGRADEAHVEAILSDPFKTWQGQVKFSMQKIATPAFLLNELIGETAIYPTNKPWPFRLSAQGTWKEKVNFTAEGDWSLQKDGTELHLKQLRGSIGSYPFFLLQELHLVHSKEATEIRNLFLKLDEAELSGELTQEHQTVAAHFKGREIPTELLHLAFPDLPVNGKASFAGYLQGPVQQPLGQLQILLHQVQITEAIFANKPSIEGEVSLTLEEAGIQLQSSLNGIGTTPVSVYGTLPFTLSLSPPSLHTSEITPFSIVFEAEGELDPYMQLFYNDTTNLSGQAKIALNLSGQMNAPRVQGSIHLYNGAYESLSTGAVYRNIQAYLEGDGSKIVLKHFSAQGDKNGSITAYGSIELDKTKEFPFEFYIEPKNIFIVESDYANISASGALTLRGNHSHAKLQGLLTTNTAIIHMEEALPKQVKSVDVKYFNLAEGEVLPNYLETQSSSSPMEFDIKLHLPSKVMIEGKHLSSEWKGEIAITGTPDNPLLNGDLRVIRGEYNFNGKVFNLTQGNIHFAGSPSKKTSLYVVTSKEIDRIRAEIIVKGPTSKPVISFRSNPPLSQREILSYILFNRGIADITSDQGDQLSQSFISLNASEQASSSDDFLTRLRNNIGIDRLDITSSDSDNKDLSLQIGKYITEGVFVSINKSISDIGNRVAIEANLQKNLKAQAEVEVGSDTQGKVSLKWKKDY